MYRIGIDLGGTNTAAGLVDAQGRIVDRENVKTNLPTELDRIVGNMTWLCHTLLNRNGLTAADVCSVGVGVPCTGNKQTGWMEDAHHLGFSGGPLVDRLKDALCLPVFIENDANAAAWGEYHAGNYDGDPFLLVTLGTGVGGGIIVGGEILTGVNNAAGEFGHMVIDRNGPLCGCGRRGCFELYGSATALVQSASRATGETITEAKEVFRRAQAEDPVCKVVLDQYVTDLADGLANLINIFGPAYLCIGGGVSHAGDALLKPLQEKLATRIFARDARQQPKIVLAKLHNDAGILGAALLNR